MKIRRRADSKSPRRQAIKLLRAVTQAEDEAPIEAMAELIRIGREDDGAREEILGATLAFFREDPEDLVPCWLALIVGELDGEAVPLLLLGLGTSEGDALDETIIPALTRRACEIFDEIEEALKEADADADEDDFYRRALYGILEGVLVAGSADQKERLRKLMLSRVEIEGRYEGGAAVPEGPLFLLACLGCPETAALVREARSRCECGDFLDCELNDVDEVIQGSDHLGYTRDILAADWQSTARHIEELFIHDDVTAEDPAAPE